MLHLARVRPVRTTIPVPASVRVLLPSLTLTLAFQVAPLRRMSTVTTASWPLLVRMVAEPVTVVTGPEADRTAKLPAVSWFDRTVDAWYAVGVSAAHGDRADLDGILGQPVDPGEQVLVERVRAMAGRSRSMVPSSKAFSVRAWASFDQITLVPGKVMSSRSRSSNRAG